MKGAGPLARKARSLVALTKSAGAMADGTNLVTNGRFVTRSSSGNKTQA